MKKVLVLALLWVCHSYSQDLPNVVPPSPTAASLAQFADVPVSYYTGLPNIGVPIYTAQSGPLSVPISLNYHGGGIKVAQEASWVGLGWSLNAGGSISRVIKGGDDLIQPINSGTRTFLESPDFPSTTEIDENDPDFHNNLGYYQDVAFGLYDTQPDIYYYSFGPFSGKFVIEKSDANEVVGRPLKAEAIKIRYLRDLSKWIVTAPNGDNYHFSVQETTTTHSYSGQQDLDYMLNYAPHLDSFNLNPTEHITTWYLDLIESATSSHVITLDYEMNLHETLSQVNISETTSKATTIDEICLNAPLGSFGLAPRRSNTVRVNITKDVYLSRINFANGYVLFNTSDREDMDKLYSSSASPQKLDDISVYQGTDTTPITVGSFVHDYFEKNIVPEERLQFLRLRLNEFQLNDQNYQFVYNDPGDNSPSKISLSIDHWGYFNNANNQNLKPWAETSTTVPRTGTLIPGIAYTVPDANGGIDRTYIEGANRNADENYTEYFILQTIKLPTGGTQTFDWESNNFRGLRLDDKPKRGGSTSACSKSDNSAYSEGNEFALSYAVKVKFIYDLIKTPVNFYTWPSGNYLGYLKWENGGWNEYRLPVIAQDGESTSSNYVEAFLEAGRYKVYARAPAANICSNARYEYIGPPIYLAENIDGAGLRINRIILNDGFTPIIKDFDYDLNDSFTSGKVMIEPRYHYDPIGEVMINPEGSSSISCPNINNYVTGSSYGIYPLSVTASNYVGYGRVLEKFKSSKNKGENIYEYHNYAHDVPPNFGLGGNIIPNFPTEADVRNGKLKSVDIRNDAGQTIEYKTYNYVIDNGPRYNTRGIFPHRTVIPETPSGERNGDNLITTGYTFRFYDNYTNWCYLDNESVTRYDENGENPIVTQNQHYYDNPNHLQLTRSENTDSRGYETTTELYYPDDVTSQASLGLPNLQLVEKQAIDKLKGGELDLHRIAEPVQTITTVKNRSGAVLSQTTQRNTYSIFGNDLVLPNSVATLKGTFSASNPLESRIEYNSYDSFGNPLEVSKESGPKISYIWGYNYSLPVAKIENATRSQIESLEGFGSNFHTGTGGLTAAQETTLRNDLSNVLVTTYEYDPLVGVTSMTDTRGYTITYIYDASNRLKEVKDEEGNLVTDYEYHYKGQQ